MRLTLSGTRLQLQLKIFPLYSTAIYSKLRLFLQIYLCLAHSFPSPPMLMPDKHQSFIKNFDHHHDLTLGLIFLEWYDALHIIIWPYWFIDHNSACSSPLPCPSVPSLCSSFFATCGASLQSVWLALHTCNRSIDVKPCLDLLHLATWLHVMSHMQWAHSLTHRWTLKISKPSPPPWLRLLTLVYLWTNHICIST
jgi:hypothetical protein